MPTRLLPKLTSQSHAECYFCSVEHGMIVRDTLEAAVDATGRFVMQRGSDGVRAVKDGG